MTERIAVTGIGVVAPNGVGKDEFWRNSFNGVSGLRPIRLFDASDYSCRIAGEIESFRAESYLGSKGLRNLDRSTLLSLVSAKFALSDAGWNLDCSDVGVVLGSTMGGIRSISEFDRESLTEGPRFVNPAQFPNTVINSPASQVAIRFALRGLNTTMSTGFTASHDALGYSIDMLLAKRAKALLVGGVEEFCLQTYIGFHQLKLLVDHSDESIPWEQFGSSNRGFLLGEGAAFFLLERFDEAVARNANIYAEILGYGSSFRRTQNCQYEESGESLCKAVIEALNTAGIQSKEIHLIASSASLDRLHQQSEEKAMGRVFGGEVRNMDRIYPKFLLGESFSASGALQMALAIGSLRRNGSDVEAVAGPYLRRADKRSDGNEGTRRAALINGSGPLGPSSALIIRTLSQN